MSLEKLTRLRAWRERRAKKEGVEIWRVLSNETLEEIVHKKARTEKDLLQVKGIKEKKFLKYGAEIIAIMNGPETDGAGLLPTEKELIEQSVAGEKVFSVSVFLDLVNIGLRTYGVKIKAEVSSVDERNGNYYFGLKDKNDGSTLSCLIWANNYRLSGVRLEEGMEIIATGFPNVYKPTGRLSFQAETLEVVGEGALKKQYEELKQKLEKEGLFALERKKAIPLFPQKIGLITSRQGEAIFDFRTNLGKFGFQIKFYDSRVEGVASVPSLLKAMKFFRHQDIDVLVLIRGGGSLESLLSFNNEMLVREAASFPIPVVTGIGHEQDVSLLDLVADRSCSTPTGAAKLLSYSWEQALARVNLFEKDILGRYRYQVTEKRSRLDSLANKLRFNFSELIQNFHGLEAKFSEQKLRLRSRLIFLSQKLEQAKISLASSWRSYAQQVTHLIDRAEGVLKAADPERMLSLGFSLVRFQGRLVRSVGEVSQGAEFQVELTDGEIGGIIQNIVKKHGRKN